MLDLLAASTSSNNEYGWYLVLLSSMACILGASVVFMDHGRLVDERVFLSCALSLGAGVLVFSSLASLLPAAKLKLAHEAAYTPYLFFLLGVIATIALTQLIHKCMPDAIHTCDVDLPIASPTASVTPPTCGKAYDPKPTTPMSHVYVPVPPCTSILPAHDARVDDHGDDDAILPTCRFQHHANDVPPSPAAIAAAGKAAAPIPSVIMDAAIITSAPFSSATESSALTAATSTTTTHHPRHSHHWPAYGSVAGITKPFSATEIQIPPSLDTHRHRTVHMDEKHDPGYLKIGMQTAIAICIHKFPEGLIMFMSGRTSVDLGISVAAAICIHNIIEGAMMAIPLYYACNSRWFAFLVAAVLGGASQPIGAVLGAFWVDRPLSHEREEYYFGMTFALVSGMMLFIAIQSMLPQAIKADPRFVSSFFFIGIFIIGLASLLKSV
ncbi:Zinc/iron permease [Gongronella butleri]|nr:Zinc/iron permease [Gongronella butleri]